MAIKPAPNDAHQHVSAAPATAGDADSQLIMLKIERLSHLIAEELALLRQNRLEDLPLATERKGQALLDLMRQGSNPAAQRPTPLLRTALSKLKELLETDRRLLKNHIDAVGEVSTLMTRAVADQEGDGTYSIVAGAGVRFR